MPELHTGDKDCLCVADHNPDPAHLEEHHIWPLGRGGPDVVENRIHVCSTTHENIHILERAWHKSAGPPPWEFRRKFNYFTRELARRAYQSAIAGRLVP